MALDLLAAAAERWEARASAKQTERAYADDPVGFVHERLGEHLWSRQRDIMCSVRDNRYTAVQSCHGIGKSYTAARAAAWWISEHPPGEAFVVSTARTFKQVRGILWREIGRAHRKGHLPGRLNQTEWWVKTPEGSEEIVGFGSKPADTDPDAFQGIHAHYVLVLIDEACGVPKSIFTAVETLVTNNESRVLAIGNPDDPSGEFAQVCRPASGWHVIPISAYDSPLFTGEEIPAEHDYLRQLLVSPEWVEERRARWGEGSPLWQSKVLGQFPEEGEFTLIPLSWCRKAQERTLEPGEPKVLGVDVARYGNDKTVVYLRRGPVARPVIVTQKEATTTTTGRVILARRTTGATAIHVDGVGVGGGVHDQLIEQHEPSRDMQAGGQSIDPTRFWNKRAEWYWNLRDLFETGDIDIDPDDDEVVAQLSSLTWKPDSRGRVLIESKDDLRKRGLPSPDRADALALAFASSGAGSMWLDALKQRADRQDAERQESARS